MKVLFVSAEVAPFSKVGGLADVAGSLPQALAALGHEVVVATPLYRMIETDPQWKLDTWLEPFAVDMNPSWQETAGLETLTRDGVKMAFVKSDKYFGASVSSETLYQPGGTQHLFFSAAILEAIDRIGWMPDVVHCNDWHTGFLPVLIRLRDPDKWLSTATIFTIHNFAYQGEFDVDVLDTLGLPRTLFNPNQVEAWGRVNFLKAGCAFADEVSTVSQTYAREIQTPELGCRLDGFMRFISASHRLTGILNGIDTQVFDPATDPSLPAHYSADDLSGKQQCRTQLLAELQMEPIEGAPLIGAVTRISGQKGLDLLIQAAEPMFAQPFQMVVQGLGEPDLCESLRQLQRAHLHHFRFIEKFDAPFAQRVYAGADLFIMPSAFEPCGLGQMIAMRYGTVPLVRQTGGLADTVFEGYNGFVFDERTAWDLRAAASRAWDAFHEPDHWKSLIETGIRADHSWQLSAHLYFALYREALHQRRLVQAGSVGQS